MEKHVHFISHPLDHLRHSGILFGFFVFLALFEFLSSTTWAISPPGILRLAAWVISLFFMVLALPQLIGGVALLQKKEWGRILVLVVAFFHLINFPLGTALGAYSLNHIASGRHGPAISALRLRKLRDKGALPATFSLTAPTN